MVMFIPIKVVSLEKQKIIEDRGTSLELFPDYLVYKANFTSEIFVDEEDESLGVKLEETDFTAVALRAYLSGVEIALTAKGKRWMIAVPIAGFTTGIVLYFKKSEHDEAMSVFNKLKNYIVHGTTD